MIRRIYDNVFTFALDSFVLSYVFRHSVLKGSIICFPFFVKDLYSTISKKKAPTLVYVLGTIAYETLVVFAWKRGFFG